MGATESLALWFLIFARSGALFIALPVFSHSGVPIQLRIALSALLAFLLAPSINAGVVTQPLALWQLVRLLLMEVGSGLLLGSICRLVFFGVEMAAGIVASEMGLTMSSIYNPMSNSASPVTGTLLYWMALVLLLSLDMHHWILAAFQRSYVLLPIGGAHLSPALLPNIILRSGSIFVVGVQIAAPMISVSFVISLVFAVLGRAVPQMNIFSESMPIRTLVGLGVFGLTCTLMAQYLTNYLRRLPEDMLSVAKLLGGR